LQQIPNPGTTSVIGGLLATELLTLERATFKQRLWEKFRDGEDKLASNRVNLGLSGTDVKGS
jgi:hypothetical protein